MDNALAVTAKSPTPQYHHIVGYFGGKMIYWESQGWKRMPATKELFEMEHWLVC